MPISKDGNKVHDENRYLNWLSQNGFLVSITNVSVDTWIIAVTHRRTQFETSITTQSVFAAITEIFTTCHRHLLENP
jgi:hypothetical protein